MTLFSSRGTGKLRWAKSGPSWLKGAMKRMVAVVVKREKKERRAKREKRKRNEMLHDVLTII